MAEQQDISNQLQFLLSELNTRLRDSEEKNRLMRERVLLLGQNLISSRQDTEDELKILKKDSEDTKRELKKIKTLTENISQEIGKFVRKDEMIVIERMLKDFQPLEFARMKDIEEIIEKKIKERHAK
ncbi:MAG: hypothetical protein WCP89_03580, partial [archaeon]